MPDMIEDRVLSRFCGKKGLSAIRVAGGLAFGTDNFALCFRDAEPGETDPVDQGSPPNLCAAITDLGVDFSLCVPGLPDLPVETCTACGGAGIDIRQISCATCGGSGRHECDCGNEHECGDCAGAGRESHEYQCAPCLGYGTTSGGLATVRIGGVLVAARYYAAIKDLPDVRFCAIVAEDHRFVAFRSGGYRGVIMGRREGVE